jgi:hypothetical protein
MLPRWLTALPRFIHTYRDELLVVTIGLVYQAGMSEAGVAHRHDQSERVVVRIAAPAPRPVMVVGMATPRVPTPAATVEAVPVRPARPVRPVHIERRVHAVRYAPARVVAPVAPRTTRPRIAPAMPARPAAPAARVYVVPEAGEHIAAAMEAGLLLRDTVALHELRDLRELRGTLEQTRAILDEARVRAALQRALSAEQARVRVLQPTGTRL